MAYLAACVAREPFGFFVAERGGEPVGFIVGLIHPNPYSGALTCVKTQWCVHPIAGRGEGVKLLRHLERWAKAAGATEIFAASLSGKGAAILNKMGYAPFETNLSKVLIP